ncbi:ROK family protein [Helcococcus kunzii]|uniref:ROK family protein n=1 Tax=Helcococcus kunzii TaxID=40091 RepID=UPI001BAECFC4|nr:ROK family protein [Helcococcus kunzii]QUY64323.1 ROK family protein [Helcococcus kunzii]
MILTLDIGGTQIKTGLINSEGQLIEKSKHDTNVKSENFNMLDRISKIINKKIEEYDIEGIAISTAGVVDFNNRKIVFANKNIQNYTGTEISKYIYEKYVLPSTVENDVNCALLGELSLEKYSEIKSAVMFTIGTGVGGSIAINGEIFRGATFSAGEVGYTIQNGKNIEDIASTTSLVKNVKDRIKKEDINGLWIFEQAKRGDKVCVEEIDNLLDNIAILINNVVSIINPDVIILGGGIMEQEEYIRPILEDKLKNILKNELVKNSLKIEFAKLGNDAGMMGAYRQFKKRYK